MSLLIDTDDEMNRYDEAALYAKTVKPDLAPGIRSSFNVGTGQTDLLAPLPSGGFVKLGSQAPEITVEAPEIMMEAPAMPGMGADAALPVEGPIARAAEQTALETEPATVKRKPMQFSARAGQSASPSAQAEAVKEVTKGLARGGIVEPAQFIDETAGGMGGIQFQIVNPETGEFDPAIRIVSAEERAETQRRMAAGELPFAFDLETLTQADTDASGVAQAAGGIAQFVGAYAGIGKLFRVGSGFKAGMTQGAAADFLGFDGSDASITDMLLEMGVPDEMLPDFLEKDPNDPDYVGRFQAAVEGAGLGAVIEKGLIPILGLAFRAVKDKDVPVDAARQAIQQGKLMMQGALLKAGQNAELRMAERGPAVDFLSSTMMSGVDPTIATDPLVAAAGRAVGGNLSKQVDNARIAYEASPNDAALRKNYLELRRQRDADPVAQVELPTDEAPGIIAFHGSGTDFSEFKLEKIGTGEGAQAFGYGLYFADSEDIANFYRQTVGGGFSIDNFSIGGIDLVKRGTYRDYSPGATPFGRGPYTPVNQLSAKDYALSSALEDIFIDEYDLYDLKKATGAGDIQTPKSGDELKQTIVARLQKTVDSKDPVNQKGEVEYLQGLISDIESGKAPIKFETEQHGHTYKVGLSLKPDDLLDYDKPLSEQPEKFKTALNEIANIQGIPVVDQFGQSASFGSFQDALSQKVGPENATREFTDAGIFGVKYRAAGSRGANVADADAGRNYVIFDDSMIKILEKYGIVGPVAISAMALSEDET